MGRSIDGLARGVARAYSNPIVIPRLLFERDHAERLFWKWNQDQASCVGIRTLKKPEIWNWEISVWPNDQVRHRESNDKIICLWSAIQFVFISKTPSKTLVQRVFKGEALRIGCGGFCEGLDGGCGDNNCTAPFRLCQLESRIATDPTAGAKCLLVAFHSVSFKALEEIPPSHICRV